MSGGWGGGRWGGSPWGGSESEDLQLLSAVAVRENVIRITFNQAPFFDGLLSPNDASNRRRYAVVVVPGSQGLDGLPARAVQPLEASLVPVVESFGAVVDLALDRSMSPWPAQYLLSVNNIIALRTGLPLDPDRTSFRLYGVRAMFTPNLVEQVAPNRDIANPQTLSSTVGLDPNAVVLGGFVTDDSGDYAIDSGTTSLKKRVFRRAITKKDGFAFLPGYGAGLLDSVKKLATARARQAMASDLERQIAQEPDVQDVSVSTTQRAVGLYSFVVRVRSKNGTSTIELPVKV